jgi:secondary thiamine-phosphate synthase enzyme
MMTTNIWHQKNLRFESKRRGPHLITQKICSSLSDELAQIEVGILHLFIKHTSASLGITENTDPTVLKDLNEFFNQLAPDGTHYHHSCEGPDDMPAHLKTVLIGHDLTIPVQDGRLALGTWQGILLFEHRDHGTSREIVCTIQGRPCL